MQADRLRCPGMTRGLSRRRKGQRRLRGGLGTGPPYLSVMWTVTKDQLACLYLRNFQDVINPNTLLLAMVISRLVILLRSNRGALPKPMRLAEQSTLAEKEED